MFFALPMAGGAMHGNDGMGGLPMGWHESAAQWQVGRSAGLAVRPLVGADVAGVLARDVPLAPVPTGTSTFRVEVAGERSRTTLHVIGTREDESVADLTVPYAVQVSIGETESLDAVIATGTDSRPEMQCRVYAGDELVAMATGRGFVECRVPPS